ERGGVSRTVQAARAEVRKDVSGLATLRPTEVLMRRLPVSIAVLVLLFTAPLHAQPAPQLRRQILVRDTPVTGVPDKVFVMLTTDFPPGVSTGRHTHPGDEYGTVTEGAVMTRQDGGEW